MEGGCLGFSKGCSQAWHEAQEGACLLFSSCSRSRSRWSGAAWGETNACSLRHFLELHLIVVFFNPDNPNRNRGLHAAHGDLIGHLPLSARPTVAEALDPQSSSSRALVADGRSYCTEGGWAEGGAMKCFQEHQKTKDWLVTQERVLHQSTLSQRSAREEEEEVGQKSRPSGFSEYLEI